MAQTKLTRKDITEWRDFIGSEAFVRGIQHLEKLYSPSIRTKGTHPELIESCISRSSYLKALDDIAEVLSTYPEVESKSDEPTLK
jgi:hypothetical protein